MFIPKQSGNIPNDNVSMVSPDTVSSFDEFDENNIVTPNGVYIPENDTSPTIGTDENGNYVFNDKDERYFIDKANNEVIWRKQVESKSDGIIQFNIDLNIDAKNVEIRIKSPSGKEYSSYDDDVQIDNIGFTSKVWTINDGEIGIYTVEAQGVNIYSYHVKVN